MAIKKATIVLEGGATRGIFTSGVLDCLMEKEIYMSDELPYGERNLYVRCDRGIGRSVQCTGLCIQAAGEDKRLYDSR